MCALEGHDCLCERAHRLSSLSALSVGEYANQWNQLLRRLMKMKTRRLAQLSALLLL